MERKGADTTAKKSTRFIEQYKKADAFFEKNYALFFAPIIALTAYLVALYVYGIWPFSNKYTAASYDLSAQICPFIEHLFDVLEGKSTLSYSYAIVGGADVTGTFLYFFISPFSFLFLLFGEGMVAQASSIVMAAKLMAIAFAGTWFAKKLFKEIPDYICIAVGLAYAYCGYTFTANTYINWMDFLIYLPFATGAFLRFRKTGNFWAFAILIACCIYTCFSIACFSMFIAFPALVCYGLLCVDKGEKHVYISRLCLAFFCALLMALPVLLPALSAYLHSGRGGGLFDELWYGFKMQNGAFVGFDGKTFMKRFERETYRKFTYIVMDGAFVVLTVIWFFRRGLKDRFAQFMLLAGVFTMLPVVVDEAMLLLNMGSYMSYALRFGFLNALYFLGGACLALEGICFKPRLSYDGLLLPALALSKTQIQGSMSETKDKKTWKQTIFSAGRDLKKTWFWTGVIVLLGIGAFGFILWFATGEHYLTFWKLFITDEQWLNNVKNISSSFTNSTGALEMTALLTTVTGVVLAVGAMLVRGKKISPRLLSIVLVAVVGAQTLFYNNQLVIGSRSTQHTTTATYSALTAQINAMETDDDGNLSYFRIKDYNDKLTADAPFSADFNSFSVFSSVIDADNFAPIFLFGYKGNGKNTIKSAHTTSKNRSDEFGDSFLGYKYFLVHKDGLNKVQKLSYATPVLVNGKQLSQGDYYMYENTIVFPLGYTVNAGDLRFSAPNDVDDENYRAENQRTLYAYLRGQTLFQTQTQKGFAKSNFVTVDTARELSEYLHTKAANVQVGAGRITATVTAAANENLFLSFVASEGYSVTVNGKAATLLDNDLHFLCVALEEGENTVEFVYHSPYPKYALCGAVLGVMGLCAVAFVDRKTKWFVCIAPVISWAGIALTVGVVAFFMIFPSAVFVTKLFALIV